MLHPHSSPPPVPSTSQVRRRVQIKFIPKNDSEHPDLMPIDVPTMFYRKELSQLLNKLLNNTENIDYEFLIKNQVLVNTLDETINQFGISFENVITVEYFVNLPTPQLSQARQTNEWVAAVLGSSSNGVYVSGGYDSRIRIWHISQKDPIAECGNKIVEPLKLSSLRSRLRSGENPTDLALNAREQHTKRLTSTFGHSKPITNLLWSNLPTTKNTKTLLSSSDDSQILSWNISIDQSIESSSKGLLSVIDSSDIDEDEIEEKSPTNLINTSPGKQYIGHYGPVKSMAICKSDPKLFASGGSDGQILLWPLDISSEKVVSPSFRYNTKGPSTGPELKPCIISAMSWNQPESLFIGTSQASLRIWDTTSETWSWTSIPVTDAKSVLSVDYSSLNGLVASGHCDPILRLWDPRIAKSTQNLGENTSVHAQAFQSTYSSHKGWISSVKFSPENPYLVATCSYDWSVKIWDIRSTLPCYSLRSHHNRVMGIDWLRYSDTRVGLVSGGQDGRVLVHKVWETMKPTETS